MENNSICPNIVCDPYKICACYTFKLFYVLHISNARKWIKMYLSRAYMEQNKQYRTFTPARSESKSYT